MDELDGWSGTAVPSWHPMATYARLFGITLRMSTSGSMSTKKAPRHNDDGPLDQARIVSATRRLVESEGLESITMRRVAAELGVSAMSLYHHVRDKRALLALVVDDVMGSVDFPAPEAGPWYERIRRNMLTVHREVSRYPGLGLYIWGANGVYPSYPRGYRQIRIVLKMLVEAGFDEGEAIGALHLLSAYEGGHFMVEREAGSERWPQPDARQAPEEIEDYLLSLPAVLGSMDVYRQGLDTLLAGLRAQLAAKHVLVNIRR